MLGAPLVPPNVVFDTVGITRVSRAVYQAMADGSIVRKALVTVCAPEGMFGTKTGTVASARQLERAGDALDRATARRRRA